MGNVGSPRCQRRRPIEHTAETSAWGGRRGQGPAFRENTDPDAKPCASQNLGNARYPVRRPPLNSLDHGTWRHHVGRQNVAANAGEPPRSVCSGRQGPGFPAGLTESSHSKGAVASSLVRSRVCRALENPRAPGAAHNARWSARKRCASSARNLKLSSFGLRPFLSGDPAVCLDGESPVFVRGLCCWVTV